MINKRAIYLALAGICLLAYANSLNNAFISDDVPAILENPKISQLFNFWIDPPSLFNSFGYLIAGHNPFIYHLFSIILHSINTILVFLFLELFFKTESSLLGACLFAVHPIHTEAVTWISGKPYLFLTFFLLTSYLLYYRSRNPPFTGKRFSSLWYCLSLAIFSYFIISNYSFFSLFPLLLVLSDVTFEKWRRNWRWWLPFIAIVILRLVLARDVISHRIYTVRQDLGTSFAENSILYFAYLYSLYSHLKLLIWPVKLTFYHDPAIITQALHNYSVFYLLPIISLLFFTFKRAKEVFMGLSIFIIFLAPTYSPMPITSLVAERYIYFPSIALSITIAFLYERYTSKYKKFRKYLLFIFIFVIVAYGIRTVIRNEDWKTPARFWRKTLAVSPKSARSHNSMGLVYLEEGSSKEAIEEFEKTIEINPKYIDAYNNLGLAYKALGDNEKAIVFLNKAIEINPQYASAYHNLGNLYNHLGNKKKAVVLYDRAIKIDPKLLKAYNNLAILYISTGENKEAIALLEKALKVNPYYIPAHLNLAIAYFNEKEYNLAVRHCDKARKLGLKVPSGLLKSLELHRQK